MFGCGKARLANYLMGVHLRAGEVSAVLQVADSAAVCEPGEVVGYGTRGQIQIGAGVAYLRGRGIWEGAADRLGPVLALPVDQRLATLTDRLGAVRPPTLAAPRFGTERKAHALAENIGAYCGEAVSARARALPAGSGLA